MARKPGWFHDFALHRQTLADWPAALLDRKDIERLFRLKPRQAATLMGKMGAIVRGKSFVISKENALGWMDRLKATGDYNPRDSDRRERFLEQMAEIRATGMPPLRVHRARPNPNSELPDGVTLVGRDEIRIGFRSGEDLLGVLLALADKAARDPLGFQASLAFRGAPE